MKIAFLKGTGLVSNLIKIWTRGPYNHTTLVFSDNMTYSCSLNGSMHTCFQHVYLDAKYWDTIEIKLTATQEAEVRAWCESEVGCAYDWTGIILSQFIPFGYHSKTKWFCSEVCVAALQHIGMFPNIKPNRVSPNKMKKLLTQ